jgi:hypothetical protein
MNSITANELKRNSVAGIERVMSESHESSVVIDVRGKIRFIILFADEFNQYREYHLELAIPGAETSLANGNYSAIDDMNDIDNYAETLAKEIGNGI